MILRVIIMMILAFSCIRLEVRVSCEVNVKKKISDHPKLHKSSFSCSQKKYRNEPFMFCIVMHNFVFIYNLKF